MILFVAMVDDNHNMVAIAVAIYIGVNHTDNTMSH